MGSRHIYPYFVSHFGRHLQAPHLCPTCGLQPEGRNGERAQGATAHSGAVLHGHGQNHGRVKGTRNSCGTGLGLVVIKGDPSFSREEGALHSVVPADHPGEQGNGGSGV